MHMGNVHLYKFNLKSVSVFQFYYFTSKACAIHFSLVFFSMFEYVPDSDTQ